MTTDAREAITSGQAVLGIELGSTRIKAVLIGPDNVPIGLGTHDWEDRYAEGCWTYSLDAVWAGLQGCFASLVQDVQAQYGVGVRALAGLGVSAMMHGYLALDGDGALLTPYRTWRNTNTAAAAGRLTAEFGLNIPHRWSVAHLYQAMLNHEAHVPDITHLTTLAGYVHWWLTGERDLGIGDASGMFPVDTTTKQYDAALLATFDGLVAEAGYTLSLGDCLPRIRLAGDVAGHLTERGAKLLDPSGQLLAGVPLCPPEGDAGTGMVATNTVAPRTGNVSAGTSIFAMVVLERMLDRSHPELDLVTTPIGDLVAMVHCNNGTSDLNAWAGLFTEFAALVGSDVDDRRIFEVLLRAAVDGVPNCAGMMAFNYLAGEPITDLDEGRPLFFRSPDTELDLATFMRAQLFAPLATLRLGIDVLRDEEGVAVDRVFAHGGLFTTSGVADRFLAAAIDTPVVIADGAPEGGAWGIALLAAFTVRCGRGPGQDLGRFLGDEVFKGVSSTTVRPDRADVAGFNDYLRRFVASLPVERAATEVKD